MEAEKNLEGRITVEARDSILLIGIHRREKRNSFTPQMLLQLQDAFEHDPDLRVGVVFGHAGHFTAGLDLPRFVAFMDRGEQVLDTPPASIRSGAGRACPSPW